MSDGLFLRLGREAIEIEHGDAGAEIGQDERDFLPLLRRDERPNGLREGVLVDHVFSERRNGKRAGRERREIQLGARADARG